MATICTNAGMRPRGVYVVLVGGLDGCFAS
jgi:hypothetical protein